MIADPGERPIHEPAPTQSLHRIVTPERSGLRLDKFWALVLESAGVSRSRISRWIKQGRARCNGTGCRQPKHRVSSGDRLRLDWEPPAESLLPLPGPLDIVWQDEQLVVLNKPPGLSVHPSESSREETLANRLLAAFPEIPGQDSFRPGIVHRLDKFTSGLMLAALSQPAQEGLMQDLADRRVNKQYLALVHGRPSRDRDCIDRPLGRDPEAKTRMRVLPEQGREALSWYETIWVSADEAFSLLQVRIHTGRTHQIRVHLAHLGHPVLGDRTYGPAHWAALGRERPALARLARRQMLHAHQLGFTHPLTGERLHFRQGVPLDFQRTLLGLQRRPQSVALIEAFHGLPWEPNPFSGSNRSVYWNWEQILEELFQPGADGLELLERNLGQPLDPVQSLSRARNSLTTEPYENRKDLVMIDTLLPLMEHRIQSFLKGRAEARAIFFRIPPCLLSRLPPTIFFDAWIQPLSWDGNWFELSTPQDGRIRVQAKELDRMLLDLRQKGVKNFLKQMRALGVLDDQVESRGQSQNLRK